MNKMKRIVAAVAVSVPLLLSVGGGNAEAAYEGWIGGRCDSAASRRLGYRKLTGQWTYDTVSGPKNSSPGQFASPSGRWELYYSPINGGSNCAQLISTKAGNPYNWMRIRIKVGSISVEDGAQYRWYAGGVYINGTNGQCATVDATQGGVYQREWPGLACG